MVKPAEVVSGTACMHMVTAQPVCLLVGAFNPFTFKLMIDMYDPITILLIDLGLLSVGLFLVLSA